MSGLANDALADVPIEFWSSKFEVKKSRLVWRRRPRESFQTEAQWRSWNSPGWQACGRRRPAWQDVPQRAGARPRQGLRVRRKGRHRP
jgi:hypothetical protein